MTVFYYSRHSRCTPVFRSVFTKVVRVRSLVSILTSHLSCYFKLTSINLFEIDAPRELTRTKVYSPPYKKALAMTDISLKDRPIPNLYKIVLQVTWERENLYEYPLNPTQTVTTRQQPSNSHPLVTELIRPRHLYNPTPGPHFRYRAPCSR